MGLETRCLACLSRCVKVAFLIESCRFFRCRDCKTLYCDPQRRVGDLSSYHASDSSHFYNTYYDSLRTSQSTEILRGLRAVLPPPATLLDIGCGNGLFVEMAAAAGYESRGIDTSLPPRHALHAADRLSQQAADMEAESGRAYDVVCALNVLEHIPAPDDFLNVVSKLLRPGGVFACAMPLSSGMIYRACEAFYRVTCGTGAIPLKTVLQWHMAAPHVFLPTLRGLKHVMRRHFGTAMEGMRSQRIVDVRNLSKRITLEKKQRPVGAWEHMVLTCGGHVLGVVGAISSHRGWPDEVFFFVRRATNA